MLNKRFIFWSVVLSSLFFAQVNAELIDSTKLNSVKLQPLEQNTSNLKLIKINPDLIKNINTIDEPKPLEPNEKQKKLADEKEVNKTFNISSFFTEYWVQIWALVLSVISVILAISGFSFANRKKTKFTSKYVSEIDDTFHSFKWKSKRCEAELYRIKDIIEEDLKKGKMDESTYHLLTNRIEKYLKEMNEIGHKE